MATFHKTYFLFKLSKFGKRRPRIIILMKELNVCPGSKSQFIKYTVAAEGASKIFWFSNYLFLLAALKPHIIRLLSYKCLLFFCLLEGGLGTCKNNLQLKEKEKKMQIKTRSSFVVRCDDGKDAQVTERSCVCTCFWDLMLGRRHFN